MFAGDSGGFAEEDADVGGVVEDVDEEAEVYRIVWEWEGVAVEGLASDLAIGAREKFYALDGDVRALLGDSGGDGAVAAADVEDGGV